MRRALDEISTPEFSGLRSKARLEAFSLAYSRILSEAQQNEIEIEATQIGVPTADLLTLRDLHSTERARILAETLRLFGNRQQTAGEASEVDRLLDEVMGTSGFEGTIPG